MILLAYSLLDTKTGHYSTPFFFNHRGHALRAAAELAGDMKTTVARHPADFTLCEVGIFDDQTGQLRTMEVIPLGTIQSLAPLLPQGALPLFNSADTAMIPGANGHAS